MAEPTAISTAAAVATGVSLAAILPGIDGNALIGAFAGGTLFVVTAKSLGVWVRLVFLAISIVVGYMAAPEMLRWLPLQSSGVAAFVASACGITITLALIERGKNADFGWFRRGGPPNG